MDHGPGHGGHDMLMCSMNMLWNTQIIDTCIVFPSWHIRSHRGFVVSCLVIVALSVLYEYLREIQKKYDLHLARALVTSAKGKGRATPGAVSGRSSPEVDYEERGLLNGRNLKGVTKGTLVPPFARVVRAALYGATVFLSFFLMLVFMTYNAYLIVAVVVGAAIGHYVFGSTINVNAVLTDAVGPRTMACH
ncbi:hypothetical protein D9615_002636 [Tricholomella constricta]|uniref:Copper transport protein n=1 Tax=Tricholomella constricta TaxID=117010 RepID=A0A8H5HMB5_9AGAR|nr:hypothetical protein D9615_002636 [Tricholomella constricta]